MTALAASPALRLPPEAPPSRLRWSVIVSVLLHLGLVVVAILAARQRHTLPEPVPPAPVAMVFEGGGAKTPPSIANPAPVSPNKPASPRPQPATPHAAAAHPPVPPMPRTQPVPQPQPHKPPQPQKQPQPHQQPEKTPPVEPPPPKPATAEVTPPKTTPIAPPIPQAQRAPPQKQAPSPAPPVQAPPQPKPAPSPPPQAGPPPRPVPSENVPVVSAPAQLAPPPEVVPLPPPPPAPAAPEAAPQTAPPRARAAARPAPMRPSFAFPAPMNLSLGSPTTESSAAPPRPKPFAGVMDLSYAANVGGGDITQLHPNGKGEDVGADWLNEVSAWWIRHRFYPEEAARLNQEGNVVLQLRVGQNGHVQAVDLEQGSGSPWLDMGALSVFRNANLPPLPGNVHDPNISLRFTIHYEILH